LNKEYADKVLEIIRTKDCLMDRETFDEYCSLVGITAQDIPLLIKYLVINQLVHCKEQGNVYAMKFHQEISDHDFGTLKVQRTISTLQKQITDIEERIQKSKMGARELVAQGRKTRALYQLKMSKNLEAVLHQRLSSLDTLDGILFKIHNSKTNVEIMNAFDAGTKTLRSILDRKELSLDNVENTMDALTEVLQDQAEIEQAMQLGEMTDKDLESELEVELDALVEAERISGVQNALDKLEPIMTPSTPQARQNSAEELEEMMASINLNIETTKKVARPSALPVPEM
jgi:charged multivesicular body protein 7